MSLLASLCAVAPKEKLYCMHIEHGLRPAEESRGDADFVSDFCKANGIECSVKHIPPGKIVKTAKRKGIGIEAAARYFRHKALSKEARRIECLNNSAGSSGVSRVDTLILLAHTKDDLLETILMRVLRGVGPAGLAAMPEKRGRIVRPLLTMTRYDVIAYLKVKNISWREDSTNSDTKYLRNKIRLMLVPPLNESFPSWKKNIASLAETQSLTAELISREAEKRIIWKKKNKPRSTATKVAESFTEEEEDYKPRTPCNSSEPLVRSSVVKNSSLFCDETVFFNQLQIIREEAVFQAINSLVSVRKALQVKSIRRVVVRQFCEGKVNAADLGLVRIKRENGKIILAKTGKRYFECGFSRLVQSGI
jgi:tRNA(Ile)-lysidine synthase